MAFTPKDWRDLPDTSTPLSAVAIEDVETRLSGYTDAREVVAKAYTDTRESAITAAYGAADTVAAAGAVASANSYTNSTATTTLASARGFIADVANAWKPWLIRNGTIPPSGSPVILLPSGQGAAIAANGKAAEGVFHFIASDYAVPNFNMKMRLRTTLISNEVTTPVSFTISARAVSAFTSGGSASGTAVSLMGAGGFTTWATHASGQLANVAHVATSAEFFAADLNVGGWTHFAITVEPSGSPSGTGAMAVLTTLEYRYV
jgi:hypothetical protein